MKKLLLFTCLLIFLYSTIATAQAVLQNESFESSGIFPAPGWRSLRTTTLVSGAFTLQPAASAVNPACGSSPGGGANLMMFNSYSASLNDTALMVTKPFDFSNNGGNNPTFSFYMYRDNAWLANDDKIQVWINTVPNMAGATLLSNTLGTTEILRRFNGAPVAVANTWNLYSYSLPAATYNGKRYYFIISGICGDGNNIYIDQVQTTTFPSATNATDVHMNLVYQNAGVAPGNVNQMVVGIRCVIGGTSGCGYIDAVTPALTTACKLDSLIMNTNGTTNLANISNAKLYYSGGCARFDTTYVSPFPVTAGSGDYPSKRFGQTIATPGSVLDFVSSSSSCFYLEYDTTYFWLTYDINISAATGNLADADLVACSVGGSSSGCPSPFGSGNYVQPDPGGFTLAGGALIGIPYCIPQYTFGTSGNMYQYTNNDYIQSVILAGANGSSINTNSQGGMSYPSNNNSGLPNNLPCLVSNGGPGCDFTVAPYSYEFWPAVSGRTAALTLGTGYTVTVQAGAWNSFNNIAVFIDFNKDGDFLDAGEKLGQVSLAANSSSSIPFVVPAIAFTGTTVMRVREAWAVTNITPCDQFNYGETEDFYVTIIPNCPPGAKTWLGYNDNWDDAINWCGGLPTITNDVQIDRSIVFPPAGTPTRNYYHPVVKSAVAANANNLTISNLDTLEINAPTPATNALKVRSDLTNNGTMLVNSTQGGNKVMGNGSSTSLTISPFKANSSDARTQIMYMASELYTAGLIAGDQITALQYQLVSKASTGAYPGFTIGYALVPNGTTFTSNVPNGAALTNVYGPVAYSNVSGANTITLSTPIIWDGSSNILIQFCFDGTTSFGANVDVMNYTQTTGLGTVLCLSSTIGSPAGCSLTPGANVSDNFFVGTKTYRPNFTFVLNRPYAKATIRAQKNWINNGVFTPAYSRVIFDSTVTNIIGGTQPTTFNELEINKGSTVQQCLLQQPVLIDTSLVLTQGIFYLNSQTLTMKNPAVTGGSLTAPAGPFTRTSGFLVSENESAAVIWKDISINGYRVIPFGSNTTNPVYIPYSFNKTAGAQGDFSVSTYYAASNLPFPAGVAHLNNASTGLNNAAAVADRFWIVSKTGTGLVTDMTFRFSNTGTSERPAGMSALNAGKLQPYVQFSNAQGWLRLITPYTSSNYAQTYGQIPAGYDSVKVLSFNWPVLPAGTAPYTYPSQAMSNTQAWSVSLNNTPSGLANITPLQITVVNAQDETCQGSGDGNIDIAVSGGTPPYTYTWNTGSTMEDQSGLSTGVYIVIVTDANGATATDTIVIGFQNSPPVTPGTLTGKAQGVCSSIQTYSVPAIAGANFVWSSPGGSAIISGQGTNTIDVQFSNLFTSGNITVYTTNPCGNSNTVSKSVYGKPAKPTVINGPVVMCTRDTVVFSTPVIYGATGYTWTVPSGMTIISGQGTNSITLKTGVNAVTNGNVCVKTLNSCGTTTNYCITVNSYAVPNNFTSITGNTSGACNIQFTYSVPAQAGITYTWTVPAGATIVSGQGTNSVVIGFGSGFGTGVISVVAASQCGATVTASKSVKGLPSIPTSITGPTTPCYNGTGITYSCPAVTGATTYTWTVPAGTTIVSGQGTNTLVVDFNAVIGGTGSLKVKSGNTCGSSSNRTVTISWPFCPRMSESKPGQQAELIPNPAQAYTMLYWYSEQEEQVSIEIINAIGQRVQHLLGGVGSGEQEYRIETGDRAPGVYFVTLCHEDGKRETMRLVITR
ncbi:MAG: GEVED domain-containing protein [Bacteroidia bacterium]